MSGNGPVMPTENVLSVGATIMIALDWIAFISVAPANAPFPATDFVCFLCLRFTVDAVVVFGVASIGVLPGWGVGGVASIGVLPGWGVGGVASIGVLPGWRVGGVPMF